MSETDNGFGFIPKKLDPIIRGGEEDGEIISTLNYVPPIEFDDINEDNFETRVFASKNNKTEAEVSNKSKARKRISDKFESKFLSFPKGSRFVRTEEKIKNLQDLKKDWSEYLKPRDEKLEDEVVDLVKVDKHDKAAFISSLHKTTESLFQFLLKEVLPIQAAIEPAVLKAAQAVSLITEAEAEIELDAAVMNMIQDSMNLKVYDFIVDKLQLSPEMKKLVLDKYFNSLSRISLKEGSTSNSSTKMGNILDNISTSMKTTK